MKAPERLTPSFREKVWGATSLAPWFPNSEKKIGEAWMTGRADPLLIKFLFTSDKLSVQVHPNDEYGRKHENSAGKTEMWHILRADPDARIALGFARPLTRERLRVAAQSGEIESLLQWLPVSAGETYFTPAGTVHAIGAGIALCEIQQNSDVTYRLYDYGRPRELHLDRATEVAELGTHPGASKPMALTEDRTLLVSCEYFVTERMVLHAAVEYVPDEARAHYLICLQGKGTLAGEAFRAGDGWRVPAGAQPFVVTPDGASVWLRAHV